MKASVKSNILQTGDSEFNSPISHLNIFFSCMFSYFILLILFPLILKFSNVYNMSIYRNSEFVTVLLFELSSRNGMFTRFQFSLYSQRHLSPIARFSITAVLIRYSRKGRRGNYSPDGAPPGGAGRGQAD